MDDNNPRYSFDPLERRGVLLGLQAGQIAAAGAGVILAWTADRTLPSPTGAVLAFLTGIAAAGATFWSKDGHTAPNWVTISVRWSLNRVRGGAVSRLPERGTTIKSDESASTARARPRDKAAWDGVEIIDLPDEPGEARLGVVIDRATGTFASVLPVSGGPFTLMDPCDQARRLELWRVTLNSLGRPGTSVRRVQWVERTSPAGSDGLLQKACALNASESRSARALESYIRVIADPGTSGQAHEVWLVTTASRPPGSFAGAPRKAFDAIRRDTRLLAGQLRNAELRTAGPLDASGLAALIESFHADDPTVRPRSVKAWWPMGEEECWSVYRAGATWHATYWIAEWPRIEIGPDFMSPLLLSGQRRTIALTMAPVPLDRAAREARSARTADAADEHLRSRAGFLPSARRDREADGTARREAELADGHAEYRFTGYVTVSSATRPDLEAACAETEQAALAAHLEIRRLYGRQREAFTWTLPFGRGLR